ncbi:MAG: alpha/beta hydrolase [Hyphomonas sp.]
MSTSYLLDPEIRPAIEAFPKISIASEHLPALRELIARQYAFADLTDTGLSRDVIEVPGLKAGQPAVRCLKYTPTQGARPSGAYLHIHGGGYVMGAPEMSDARNVRLASALGITVLSVDYRLAPEHPIPAPLDDCYAALAWMSQNAKQLGIDPQRIAIGGESAGGGLATATAQWARDTGDYPICFQLLTYPMIDDRTGSAEKPGDPLTGEFIWTRDHNRTGWAYYLGDAVPAAPYVPARATDLSRLPPTWIVTAAMDLFRDENIDYAQRLLSAGVATELVVYPRVCHGFQQAADAQVTKRYLRDQLEALRRGLRIADQDLVTSGSRSPAPLNN